MTRAWSSPPRARALCLAVMLAHIMWSASASANRATTDLWDFSQGAMLLETTPLHPGFRAEDVFGTELGTVEPGNTVFADGLAQGTVHSVEWQTATPVTIERFRLFAYEDSPDNNRRSIEHVRLLAFVDDGFETLFEADVASPYPYLEPFVLFYQEIAPVTAQRFRAEFTQHLPPGISGPRIIELDGFSAFVLCADVNYDTLIRATDALITLNSAVGSAGCEHCVCDVTGRDGTKASDALRILQLAVGQDVEVSCPPCDPRTSTNSTTTTIPPGATATMNEAKKNDGTRYSAQLK